MGDSPVGLSEIAVFTVAIDNSAPSGIINECNKHFLVWVLIYIKTSLILIEDDHTYFYLVVILFYNEYVK